MKDGNHYYVPDYKSGCIVDIKTNKAFISNVESHEMMFYCNILNEVYETGWIDGATLAKDVAIKTIREELGAKIGAKK